MLALSPAASLVTQGLCGPLSSHRGWNSSAMPFQCGLDSSLHPSHHPRSTRREEQEMQVKKLSGKGECETSQRKPKLQRTEFFDSKPCSYSAIFLLLSFLLLKLPVVPKKTQM